jgi:DNA-directed RNA polymerase specialized sigma24 family protein
MEAAPVPAPHEKVRTEDAQLFGSGRRGGGVTPEDVEKIFVDLFKAGEIDKIVARLAYRFAKVSRDVVTEVVQEATAECARRLTAGHRIPNPAGLIVTIAKRALIKVVETMDRERNATLDHLELVRSGAWREDEEWERQSKRALEYISAILESWPSGNLRNTMLLILEASKDHQQLSDAEIGDLLGADRDTAKKWRYRACDRLQERLIRDGLTWDTFAHPLRLGDDLEELYDDMDDSDQEDTEQ